MKILILTVDPCFPPISGADLRNWQNALALTKFGHVTLASLRPAQPNASAIGVHDIEVVTLTAFEDKRTAAIARRTTPIDVRIPKSALAKLKMLLQQQDPNIIVVEGIQLFPLLKHLRPHAKFLVLDMHNVESELVRNIPSRRALRNFLISNTRRLRQREQKAARIADQIWVCSLEDRERVSRLIDAHAVTCVVPNGLPRPDCYGNLSPATKRPKTSPRILFVGHLSYWPNKEAIKRLAGNIFSRVKSKFPEAQLTIVGRFSNPEISRLAHIDGSIRVIADPAELAPIYAQADLSIIPLSSGGGTRIKILEAMAFGIPVIATTLAAEGHDFVNGEEILIADTDEEILDGICMLSSDPEKYAMQRSRAFDAVHRRFGPTKINDAVRQALSGVIGSPH